MVVLMQVLCVAAAAVSPPRRGCWRRRRAGPSVGAGAGAGAVVCVSELVLVLVSPFLHRGANAAVLELVLCAALPCAEKGNSPTAHATPRTQSSWLGFVMGPGWG